jgi:hypothetical protein
MSSDPSVDGGKMVNQFLREHYHTPGDDLHLHFSEESATQFARVALTLALIVANDNDRPKWKEGDFFGERFGRDQ